MKKEYKKYGTLMLVIALTILSLLYMLSRKGPSYELISPVDAEPAEEAETALIVEDVREEQKVERTEKLPVYMCGQVNKPEVYYLDQGAIIKEAIGLAGGFTDEADREVWNLAMEVQKGQKIYVPKVGEKIDKNEISYDNGVGGLIPSNSASGLININRANSQELSTLPGVGPSISQNIIDYRDANGDFKNIEELTNVSRIGKLTLEKIKDSICVQ